MNYNAATGAYVAVNSIDLLEECLETIHRARKMSLQARSERAQALLDRRRAKLASQQSRISVNRTSFEKFDVKAYEKDMANTAYDDNPAQAPKNIARPSQAVSDDESDELNINAPPKKSTVEVLSNEQKAEKLLQEFEKELSTWWQKAGEEKRGDDDARGEYADYLTDKYMCQKLDAFPPSKEITAIRKFMYQTIENFATDPNFTVSHTATTNDNEDGGSHPSRKRAGSAQRKHHTVEDSSHTKPGQHIHDDRGGNTKKDIAKAKTAASSAATSSSKALTPAERAIEQANAQAAARLQQQQQQQQAAAEALSVPQLTAKEEKALAEKNKLQEQYQQYMKMKQLAAEADRESQLKQYESLNDDIKGLLTSIQNNKSIT